MRSAVLILLLGLLSVTLKAQVVSNQRIKKLLLAKHEEIKLDTLSIIPKTFAVKDGDLPVDTSLYSIDFDKTSFTWKGEGDKSLSFSYKVFPILLSKRYFNKDVSQLENLAIDNSKYYLYQPIVKENTLFSLQGLNKSGSISRGLMFGNNQNLSVNSNMALQMSGKIANDIEIVAAISDDNLPIQPEGNTQQLNEFDRVFIQLKKDSTTLTAGDYELKRPDSYFMNFYKRTQGAMVNHQFVTKDGVKSSTSLALAVAKGRSARNLIAGQEGNQGPYRLAGNNGEMYIVVIAGTERVYIDGVLLTRGQDNDYVIDYNTSEITFTARQIINLNSRISVEFEYADKNYARSLSYVKQSFEYEKLAFRLNYYNEKDNRNQPFLQTLGDSEKQFLASLGKNIGEAQYPNIKEVEFSESEILYERLTSPLGTTYYRYSIDPQLAKYRLGFSYVGEGMGNYKLNNQSAANGKVYEFIEPVAGVTQGNYEPITLLVTPKQQQLITVAADFKPKKNSLIAAEFAMSNNNVNLFADKELANDRGYGLKMTAAHPFLLNEKGLKLNTSSSYEYASSSFTPIERYRAVEFNRDFNLDLNTVAANEHILTLGTQLFKSNLQHLGYSFSFFNRTKQYEGALHKVSALYKAGKNGLSYEGSWLNNNGLGNTGLFNKHHLDINRQVFKLMLGFAFEQQHKETLNTLTEELSGNSQSYAHYKVYLQSIPSAINKYKVEYSFRQDQLPSGGSLLNSSNAKALNISLALNKNVNSQLNLTVGYRKTAYSNNFSNVNNDENLVGRLDYNLNAWKGFINNTIYYEVGNGQEPRREITYLEVLPGQGIYAWIDYNENGIKELDEFEISRFPDQAKYIRIFTASTNYVRTNFTGISQTFRLTPSALLKGTSAFTKFTNRFTNQLSFKIDRKILATNGLSVYNPFNTSIDADNLISLASFFRNTLFFNRNNPKFGLEFNYVADGGKSYLSNGFDARDRNEGGLKIRTAIAKSTQINLVLNSGTKNYSSELFVQRNYSVSYQQVMPELTYQYSGDFRTVFAGIYGIQNNAKRLGNEKNKNLTFITEARYNVLKKGVLTGKISFIKNKFDGNANSTIGYEMLSGLQTGNNFTWSLGLQRSIGNGIQLNLGYDGRKSENVSVIHTGNMQVRAFF